MPTERYAKGEKIRRQAVRIAEHYDLYRDTLFQTRSTSLAWDEDRNEWTIATDRGDRFGARYVITSTGTLTQPKLPGIPGIEDFRGHTFHTSRWDYGYTGGTADGNLTGLTDKRVAVVGTSWSNCITMSDPSSRCTSIDRSGDNMWRLPSRWLANDTPSSLTLVKSDRLMT